MGPRRRVEGALKASCFSTAHWRKSIRGFTRRTQSAPAQPWLSKILLNHRLGVSAALRLALLFIDRTAVAPCEPRIACEDKAKLSQGVPNGLHSYEHTALEAPEPTRPKVGFSAATEAACFRSAKDLWPTATRCPHDQGQAIRAARTRRRSSQDPDRPLVGCSESSFGGAQRDPRRQLRTFS